MTALLSDAEIDARLSAIAAGEGGAASSPPSPSETYRYVRRLADAAESLISSLDIEDGIGLGLPQIDVLTRGFRPSDLVLITGFAHSGKTQLVNTMIVNNPHKRILFFSLDDPAEMILAKLVGMHTGVNAEQLENEIKQGDRRARDTIRSVASETFSNLIVVDDVIGIPQMQIALQEACEAWGEYPDAQVIDYLEMMPGDGQSEDQGANVKSKANALKAWAKEAEFPFVVLHQGTRSNAKPGHPITMLSLGYSGEQQGTIIIGVRRKRDNEDEEAYVRETHANTVTLHVVKNKRPGGRCTRHDGVDFYMDPATGLVRPLRDGDTQRLFNPTDRPTAAQAMRHAQGTLAGTERDDHQLRGEAA